MGYTFSFQLVSMDTLPTWDKAAGPVRKTPMVNDVDMSVTA